MLKKIASFLLPILLTLATAALVFFATTDVDVKELLQRFGQALQNVAEGKPLTNTAPPNYATVTEGERALRIGMDYAEAESIFGEPCESFVSEYGFVWHAFHDKYKNYIQIGERDKKVVAIYTNSLDCTLYELTVGSSKEEVHTALGQPLDAIVKGNTKYVMNGIDQADTGLETFLKDGQYVTVFYDVFKNNSVTSFHIIEYQTEQDFCQLYGKKSAELQKAFERQNFLLTNAIRVREGLPPLEQNSNIYNAALSHAQDMAMHSYFDHTDLSGGSVATRAKRSGVRYTKVGENIAMGAQNTLYMHELLMNSEGHRKNILANYGFLGCGVAFAADDTPYLAQNFYQN